jgi:hypothetical protein
LAVGAKEAVPSLVEEEGVEEAGSMDPVEPVYKCIRSKVVAEEEAEIVEAVPAELEHNKGPVGEGYKCRWHALELGEAAVAVKVVPFEEEVANNMDPVELK